MKSSEHRRLKAQRKRQRVFKTKQFGNFNMKHHVVKERTSSQNPAGDRVLKRATYTMVKGSHNVFEGVPY